MDLFLREGTSHNRKKKNVKRVTEEGMEKRESEQMSVIGPSIKSSLLLLLNYIDHAE